MTTRMARRSHFFDQTINELKIGYASRLNEKNNEESLLKKLTEDFSQLKVAIKLQDTNHQTTLNGLNQELIQLPLIFDNQPAPHYNGSSLLKCLRGYL